MNWKEISKSSYSLDVGKFQEWVSTEPFTIPLDANKITYNEGDEITSASNPVFNVDFTSNPITQDHNPCGYWHKNYTPQIFTYYTSKPYPLELIEEIQILSSNLISGKVLGPVYDSDYLQISSNSLISGTFYADFILKTLEPTIENFTITSNNLVSGIFYVDFILVTIDARYDGLQISTNSLISGTFDDVVISYEYWPSEGLQINSNILVRGTHGI